MRKKRDAAWRLVMVVLGAIVMAWILKPAAPTVDVTPHIHRADSAAQVATAAVQVADSLRLRIAVLERRNRRLEAGLSAATRALDTALAEAADALADTALDARLAKLALRRMTESAAAFRDSADARIAGLVQENLLLRQTNDTLTLAANAALESVAELRTAVSILEEDGDCRLVFGIKCPSRTASFVSGLVAATIPIVVLLVAL